MQLFIKEREERRHHTMKFKIKKSNTKYIDTI